MFWLFKIKAQASWAPPVSPFEHFLGQEQLPNVSRARTAESRSPAMPTQTGQKHYTDICPVPSLLQPLTVNMLKIVLLRAEYMVRALPPLPPEAWLLCRSRGLWTTWPPHQATALWDCALWLDTRYIGIGLTSTPQALLGRSGNKESLLALAALGCPGTELHLQPPDLGSFLMGPLSLFHTFFSGGKHVPICNSEHPQAPSSLIVTSENTEIGGDTLLFPHAAQQEIISQNCHKLNLSTRVHRRRSISTFQWQWSPPPLPPGLWVQ